MKKKEKKKRIEWVIPEEEEEKEEEEDKPSLLDQIRDAVSVSYNPFSKPRVPLTFGMGVAIILFFTYLSIAFVCLQNYPFLLFIIIPTLWALARLIKLERERYEERK